MSHKIYTPTSFSQHYENLDKEESGSYGKVYKVCTRLYVDSLND